MELLYLAVCTRLYVSFAVGALEFSLHAPTTMHPNMVQSVFRYLSITTNLGIHFSCKPTTGGLDAYSDADLASCEATRHSTTGLIILGNGSPICFQSVRQSVVALSSTESSYIAVSPTSRAVSLVSRLYAELHWTRQLKDSQRPFTTLMYVGNFPSIALASNEGVTACIKHI